LLWAFAALACIISHGRKIIIIINTIINNYQVGSYRQWISRITIILSLVLFLSLVSRPRQIPN